MGIFKIFTRVLLIFLAIYTLGYAAKYSDDYNGILKDAKQQVTGYAAKKIIIPIADNFAEKAHALVDTSIESIVAQAATPAPATKSKFIPHKTHFNNQEGNPNPPAGGDGSSSATQNSANVGNNKFASGENQSNIECCKCV